MDDSPSSVFTVPSTLRDGFDGRSAASAAGSGDVAPRVSGATGAEGSWGVAGGIFFASGFGRGLFLAVGPTPGGSSAVPAVGGGGGGADGRRWCVGTAGYA